MAMKRIRADVKEMKEDVLWVYQRLGYGIRLWREVGVERRLEELWFWWAVAASKLRAKSLYTRGGRIGKGFMLVGFQ